MPISRTDAPRHETPNAVMRTLAAPSLGSSELAVWEVVMRAAHRGPEHAMDREQVWTVLEGELRIDAGDNDAVTLRSGDTLCLPPDVPRQITALEDARAIVASPADPTVTQAGVRRPLPWAS